jgi:hypothetical protein
MYADRILSVFTHRMDISREEHVIKLAMVWDKVLRSGIYALLETIVAMVEHCQLPEHPDEGLFTLLSLNITSLSMQQLSQITVKPAASYQQLLG